MIHARAGAGAPGHYGDAAHRLTQPVSIGFDPGFTLKGVQALVHFVTPLRLVRRTRTVP